MKKNKKGFTLIELLVTIAVLAIIVSISFILYGNYSKNAEKKLIEIEKQHLIGAAKMFYTEFGNTSDYLSYVTDEEIDGIDKKVKYSCVSIKNLVDKGFYKITNDNIKKMVDNNEVIEVKDVDGTISYKVINQYDKYSHCSYWDENDELMSDIKMDLSYENDQNSSVKIYPTINKSGDGAYTLSLRLVADTVKVEKISYVPVYVTVVLDSSGSMNGTKHNAAMMSSKSLSEEIVKLDDSYVSLINFDYTSYLRREFSHNVFIDSDFKSPNGQTNIPAALLEAYNLNKNLDSKSIKYVIFLTDGKPEAPTSYNSNYYSSQEQYEEFVKCKNSSTITDDCKNVIIKYADMVKSINNLTLVVIGYSISNDFYPSLPSLDDTGIKCPDSDNGNYCYYKSDSTKISGLFNNISNTIKEVVKSQTVSKTDIKARFNKYLVITDKDGNDVTEDFNINFNIKDAPENQNTYDVTYTYTMNLDDINSEDYVMNEDRSLATYVAKLFDDFNIYLYDYSNSIIGTINLDNNSIPEIKVTRTLKSYLN